MITRTVHLIQVIRLTGSTFNSIAVWHKHLQLFCIFSTKWLNLIRHISPNFRRFKPQL